VTTKAPIVFTVEITPDIAEPYPFELKEAYALKLCELLHDAGVRAVVDFDCAEDEPAPSFPAVLEYGYPLDSDLPKVVSVTRPKGSE
jgi:hypothetical protein